MIAKHYKDQLVWANAHIILLQIIAFLLPVYQRMLPPVIALWAIFTIINAIKTRHKIRYQKSNLWLMLFYGLLIAGVFWSENQKMAVFDLEVKMSLVLFPIFFSFFQLSKIQFRRIILSFLIGVLSSSIILLLMGFYNFLATGNFNSIFYSNLSPYVHPSYTSFYVVLSLFMVVLDWRTGNLKLTNKIVLYPLVTVYLFLFSCMLLSKIGILAALLVILYFLVKWIIQTRQFLKGGILLAALGLIFLTGYLTSNYAKERIDELFVGLFSNAKRYDDSSSSIRLKIWSEGIELVKDKPLLGYGTGDVKDELMKRYLENGHEVAYKKQLNAHNQFLQITISLGFIGLGLFFLALGSAFFAAQKGHNQFLIGFVLLFILYALPESLLENQAGTIFFGFFFALLTHDNLNFMRTENSFGKGEISVK